MMEPKLCRDCTHVLPDDRGEMGTYAKCRKFQGTMSVVTGERIPDNYCDIARSKHANACGPEASWFVLNEVRVGAA